jgi:16S rRNA (guanine527-N7)-methyltransferase
LEGLAAALDAVLPADLPRRAPLLAGATRHAELVADANERQNLTRITAPRDVAVKHVLDCLAPWRRLVELATTTPPPAAAGASRGAPIWVDLGSGAGYPGILLALLLPGVRVVLVESIQKKAAFLAEVVHALGLANVEVAAERGEERLARAPADVVVARAVDSARELLRLLKGSRANWRRLVLYKGPGVETEMAQAAKEAEKLGLTSAITARYELPDGAGARCLLEYARGDG